MAGRWWNAATTWHSGTAAWTCAATLPARRHEWLELGTDPDEGVGHAHHNLAAQLACRGRGLSSPPSPTGWRSRRDRTRRRRRCRRYESWSASSGYTLTSSSRASIARYFDRDPITVSYPMLARRAASPLPAGPVPPKMPMRITSALHLATGHGKPAMAGVRPPPLGRPRLASGAMGLLDGKKIVVTGVLTDASLAFGVARIALEEGAEIVLTGAGRALSLTRRTARKLTDCRRRRDRRVRARRDGSPNMAPRCVTS